MKKIVLPLLAVLCCSAPVFSQNNQPVIPLDTVVSRLQTLSVGKAIEKLTCILTGPIITQVIPFILMHTLPWANNMNYQN